jgi:hypothetical protein
MTHRVVFRHNVDHLRMTTLIPLDRRSIPSPLKASVSWGESPLSLQFIFAAHTLAHSDFKFGWISWNAAFPGDSAKPTIATKEQYAY